MTMNILDKAFPIPTILAVALAVVVSLVQERNAPQMGRSDSEAQGRALQEIDQLFDAGRYDAVVGKADEFIAKYTTSIENASALFYKAESQYRLGQTDAAIQGYESGLATVEAIANNVKQRSFAPAYFRLALLLRERNRLDAAVARVEAGLRLVPQLVDAQILLGQLLVEHGQRDRALKLYRSLLASSLPLNEERVVIGVKAVRLAGATQGAPVRPPPLRSALLYESPSIGIVPINQLPSEVALSDVCTILESIWRMRCEVLSAITIPEADVLVADRNQYDADRLLIELQRRVSAAPRRHTHILGITGRDIFAPQTSFVFSWQSGNEQAGVGVLSTSRFTSPISDYYEPAIVATRRIAIQALSTTGSMFGFTRPTDPECPLAYPESLREFQQKRLRLCDSDKQQRDQLLARRGGKTEAFGTVREAAIARVYRTYFLE
jgi:predicted Zn-dependent protease/predicted negative regulator of RcsB-dependent stress response